MATLEALPGIDAFVREAIEERKLTHEQVSLELKAKYSLLRGVSSASVKRYCRIHGIHKTARLDRASLDRLVSLNVMRVSNVFRSFSVCT